MEIYFANKAGKPSKLLFNSNQAQKQPQQQPAHQQMGVSRKSILMQDKEQTLRDKIKIDVVGIVPSKLKINPDIYAFNITSVVTNQRVDSIDFLDEMQMKNKEKQQNFQELIMISKEISNMKETKSAFKKPSLNDPVAEIVNLLGCDYQKAEVYLKRYGTVEKAFMGSQTEQSSIEEFQKRFKVREEEARFYLESSGYNLNQAAQLMNGGR